MIEIRPMTDDDLPAAAEVHVRSWQAAYAGILPPDYLAALDPVVFAARTREMPLRQGLLALQKTTLGSTAAHQGEAARHEPTPVGLASFGPYREDSGAVDHSRGELYSLYVEPGVWGRGAGRALMEGVISAMTGTYPNVYLWVIEANVRARRFYERTGFTPDGTRDMWTPRGTTVTVPELRYSMAL